MKHIAYLAAGLLVASAMCAGCSKDVWNALTEVESYIHESPDSALVELRGIDTSAIHGGRTRAKYALLLSMALDKNYIDTTDVRIIHPAVEYYSKHGPDEYLLKALYYEGRVHFNGREYDEAILDYTQALPLIDRTADVKYHGMLYMAISATFQDNYNYDESIKYAKLAYEAFSGANMKQLAATVLHSLAGDMFNIRNYIKADSLYRRLLSSPDIVNPERAEIESSYAFMCAARRGEYFSRADSLYSSAIRSNGTLNSDKHWGSYAFTLSKLGKYAKSDSILTRLEERNPRVYIYWKSMSDAARGDSASAYKYLIKTLAARDTTVLISLNRSTVKAQRDYFEWREQEVWSQLQSRSLMFAFLVCFVIALLAIAVMWMRNRASSFQMELDKLAQFNDSAESALDDLEKRNDTLESERRKLKESYLKMYRNQFAFLAELGEKLATHRYGNSIKAQKMVYKDVHEALKDMMNEDGATEFERRINESMGDVMRKFREDFPDMPNADYKFVSFVFAGFDPTLISVLLDFPTTGAVSTKKSRLKKHISNNPTSNTEMYLELF